MGDEAEYLESQATYDEVDEELAEEDYKRAFKNSWALYDNAVLAKIGSTIHCPSCGKKIVKTTYHKKFCSTGCKDRFWNRFDSRRRARAIAHLNRK